MKVNQIVKCFLTLAAVVVMSFGCVQPDNSGEQENTNPAVDFNSDCIEESFVDSNRIVYNPDIGFYSAFTVLVTEDGIDDFGWKKELAGRRATLFKEPYDTSSEFNLIHLKMDISNFSKWGFLRNSGVSESEADSRSDKELTQKALNDIKELLDVLRENDKTTVIRFAYDPKYAGKYDSAQKKYFDVEPESLDMIKTHINQISPILVEYEDVITAIECGLLGPYGEMHGTTKGEDHDAITKVIGWYLDALSETDIPLLVRQPVFIMDYLGLDRSSSVPSYVVQKGSKAYKLGLYNDGYLGSKTDTGTYKINREQEIEFAKQFTNHTPFGGELIGYNSTENSYGDIDQAMWSKDSAIEEMYDVHLSFLNIGWNHAVLNEMYTNSQRDYSYKNENRLIYILKHMGYRFVLEKSTLTKSSDAEKLKIVLDMNNNGFGNLPMHRNKTVTLMFYDTEADRFVKNVVLNRQITSDDCKNFKIQSEESGIDISDLEEGKKYKIYIKMCDADGKHAIEFANDKNNFNSSVKANYAGTFIK